MALLARARQLESEGRSIVHMEIGEPDFETPAPVIDAGIQALRSGQTRYTPAAGLPALREAIAAHYRGEFNVAIDPARVFVTPGASGALQLATAVLVEEGSEVLMADPGYPCNRNFVHLLGGIPVSVPVGCEQDYQLNAGLLEQYWSERTVAALLATPSNPTGTTLSETALSGLLSSAQACGGRLIVDEIYQSLYYGARPHTALGLGDDMFVINSFSKYFGMTGWRLGWLVAPTEYLDSLDMLAQNLFLSASTPAQYAALAALEPGTREILEARRAEFQARRDYLMPALRSIGFRIDNEPAGAFYLYADCSQFTDDSYAFSHDLLETAGVAVTPGIYFGSFRAAQHVRFAYTTSLDQLRLGVERIAGFVRAH